MRNSHHWKSGSSLRPIAKNAAKSPLSRVPLALGGGGLSPPPKMHVIKRAMENYDTTRQYLNFVWAEFWYLSSFSVTWPSNLGFLHVRQTNFAPYEESTGGPVRGLFFIKINVSLNSKRNHRRQHHCIVINGGGWSGKKDHCGFNGIRH